MEPETTSTPSTNQPPQTPATPPAEAPTAQPEAAAPASLAASEPVIPVSAPPTPAPSVPAPEAPSQPTPAPETPVTPSPAQAPVSASVPPVPPVTAPASVPAEGGSHTGMIIGVLVVSLLLAGGAGAYYWMKTTAQVPAPVQALEAATSTESTSFTMGDPNLRGTLEGTIGALNVAMETGSYESFIRVIDSPTASQITKEQFDQAKGVLKEAMFIDIAKLTFLEAKQQGEYAGYYYTLPKTSGAETYSVLSMVTFVKENGGWRVARVFSKNLAATDDISAVIATDANFSFVPSGNASTNQTAGATSTTKTGSATQ